MSELSDKLQALAAKAEAGTLTDADRVELAEIGQSEGAKATPQRLGELANQAAKGDLSPQARRDLEQIGATVANGLLSRASFDRLGQSARAELLRSGVRVVDAPQIMAKRGLQEKEIRRSQFDVMNHSERSAHLKAGGLVVDDELITA